MPQNPPTVARCCAFLIVVLGLLSHAARAHAAGAYDPALRYFTLTTPHFFVVHADGYQHLALRTARMAEDLAPYLAERYGTNLSGRTTIIINDQTDYANGSATILPNKVITLYVTAPTEVSGLEDYDDWLYGVLVHELAHIYHIDMVFGLPWVGRQLFGKYVALNQYTPAWVTEGLAVYEETISSASGRGRSTYVDMVLRMAALSNAFPSLDRAFRSYSTWPFSNVAYFFGGRFQLWLAENYGEEALMRYHRAYASTPVPYVTWLAAEIAFGSSLENLWLAFEQEVTEDAIATRARLGRSPQPITEPVRLTSHGGDLLGPRITPDGHHVIFSTHSPSDGSRVRRISIDGGQDRVLLEDTFSKAISITQDGSAFYCQQTDINRRYYYHNDILRYDIASKKSERVRVVEAARSEFVAPSGSLRARDPDISNDGRKLVFVQSPYGANRLVLADVSADGVTIVPQTLIAAEPDVQFSNPRFSPDGTQIVVSRFKEGRRDLLLVDLRGAVLKELTRDRHQDIDATWSPDGRWIVFSSDRDGIYNLYAYNLDEGRYRRLTNLVSGAYQAAISFDQTTLVFRGYSADGFDVYRIPFFPNDGLEVTFPFDDKEVTLPLIRRWPPPRPERPSLPPPAPFKDTPLPQSLPPSWEMTSYQSLDTLLPIHDNWNLFPLVAANEHELFLRLTHFGGDALETHKYLVAVDYGSRTNFVGGGIVYVNDVFEPTLSLSLATDARTFLLRDRAGEPLVNFDEQRRIGVASIGLPIRQRHYFSASYVFEHRSALRPLSDDTLALARALPVGGNFARLQLGYAYNNTRRFFHSISSERGFSASASIDVLSPILGSDFEEIVLQAEARHYFTLPYPPHRLLENHVLASRLSGMVSLGRDLMDRARMGGASGDSALTTTTQNFFPLRGLLLSGLDGTALVNGSVEYRAPLWRLERGFGTIPAVFRVLHAAVFSDFGRVFEGADKLGSVSEFLSAFALSIGAELRANILLGYLLELELRVGYAHILHTPDARVDASGPFFQIGSTY